MGMIHTREMEGKNTRKPDAEEVDSEREGLPAGLRVLARIIAREEIRNQRDALSTESTQEELPSYATH